MPCRSPDGPSEGHFCAGVPGLADPSIVGGATSAWTSSTPRDCLFDKATQQKVVADRSSHSLGQKWSWVSAKEGAWVGKLSGGERCFNGPPRSFTVEFTCGPKEVLGAVSEKEVCTYGATLTTPAAC